MDFLMDAMYEKIKLHSLNKELILDLKKYI